MAARLSDSELAARVRQRSQQRSIRYRERLSQAGKVQTMIWLPAELRTQLDRVVSHSDKSLSAVTAELLTAALTQYEPPPPVPAPSPDPLPLFADADDAAAPASSPVTSLPSDRDARILALHGQGLSGCAIARQLGISEPTVRRTLKRLKEEAV